MRQYTKGLSQSVLVYAEDNFYFQPQGAELLSFSLVRSAGT